VHCRPELTPLLIMRNTNLLYTVGVLSIIATLTTIISAVKFIFSPFDTLNIYCLFGFLALAAILIGVVYYLKLDLKSLSREDQQQSYQAFLTKIPLLILTFVLTLVFAVLYFFFFAFIAVSSYGNGGVGANASFFTLILLTFIGWLVIAGFSFQKVLNTDSRDISLTIYNQFSILKWTALCVLPIGIWSCHYFYHYQGAAAFIAMIFWDLVLIGVYKGCSLLASKVHNHITDANVNRILHEKKKAWVERNKG
jgi:hypothetical protein